MTIGSRASEIQPEAHFPGVQLADPDTVAEDVVARDAGHRVQIPVDAQRDVVGLSAPDVAVVEIDAREARCDLPGSEPAFLEERVPRPDTVDGAILAPVGAILAREEPAGLHVVAVQVVLRSIG